MIIWRSQESEWRRYVDYFFIALMVALVGASIYGLFNWGNDGDPEVQTIPAGLNLTPPSTTIPERTLPPELTLPEDTTTVPGPTTSAAVVTTGTTVPTTTIRGATTVAPTVPSTAAPPPPTAPPDTKGPTIGSLRTSPGKIYEAPCTPTGTYTVSITDASGVASAEMLQKPLQRRAGTNDWYTTAAMSDIAPTGGSTTVPIQIIARDTRGNRSSVGVQVVVHDCDE